MNYTLEKLVELSGCSKDTVQRYLERPEFSHVQKKTKFLRRKSVEYCGVYAIVIKRLQMLCAKNRKKQAKALKWIDRIKGMTSAEFAELITDEDYSNCACKICLYHYENTCCDICRYGIEAFLESTLEVENE